jgi:hypothetical protein
MANRHRIGGLLTSSCPWSGSPPADGASRRADRAGWWMGRRPPGSPTDPLKARDLCSSSGGTGGMLRGEDRWSRLTEKSVTRRGNGGDRAPPIVSLRPMLDLDRVALILPSDVGDTWRSSMGSWSIWRSSSSPWRRPSGLMRGGMYLLRMDIPITMPMGRGPTSGSSGDGGNLERGRVAGPCPAPPRRNRTPSAGE